MFGKASTIGLNLSIKESLSEKCVIGEWCKWRVMDLVESGLCALTRKPSTSKWLTTVQSLRGKAGEGHQETAWTMENTDILLSSISACLLATMSQGSWCRMLGDEGQRGCPLKYRAGKRFYLDWQAGTLMGRELVGEQRVIIIPKRPKKLFSLMRWNMPIPNQQPIS